MGKPRGKPFKKGDDPRRKVGGNKGCGKIRDAIIEQLSVVHTRNGHPDMTAFDIGIQSICGMWMLGDPWACTFVADRCEGKVKDVLQVKHDTKLLSSDMIDDI